MESGTLITLRKEINKLNKESENGDIQDAVLNDLDKHANNWNDFVIMPFYYAYGQAYERYHKELKKREEDRKARAELAMFALTIVGGSIISTLLSKTTFSKVLDDAVLNTLAKRNMDRTFDAYATGRGNPAMQFILNQSTSDTSKWLTGKTTKAITEVDNWAKEAKPTKPNELKEAMRTMYNRAENALRNAFTDILEAKALVTPEEKKVALKTILASAFCRAPKGNVYPKQDILAKKIELTFYLKMIIQSDYTQKALSTPGTGGIPAPGKRILIATSAQSATYPTNTRTRHAGGFFTETNSVGYEDLGDNITKRINELYKDKNIWSGADGSDLIEDRYWPWSDRSDKSANARAERVLDQINMDNIGYVRNRTPPKI